LNDAIVDPSTGDNAPLRFAKLGKFEEIVNLLIEDPRVNCDDEIENIVGDVLRSKGVF
jgi:hypothetical protein